jgi:hypothetical protein
MPGVLRIAKLLPASTTTFASISSAGVISSSNPAAVESGAGSGVPAQPAITGASIIRQIQSTTFLNMIVWPPAYLSGNILKI